MLAVAREGLKDKLPDQVAVWTSEHDADNPEVKREPRFAVGELEVYPISQGEL
jgi:hypothetical protein